MKNLAKTKVLLLIVVLTVVCCPPRASAGESDEIQLLREQLETQARLLHEMQERLAQLEARQESRDKSLTEKIEEVEQKADKAEAAVAAAPTGPKATWPDRISLSGDFRYRHESIDAERNANGGVDWRDGRSRHRIRARAMISAIVNDEWDAIIRLATGQRELFVDNRRDMIADPVSTNQTLTQSFSKKDWWLDLAYFDFHPASVKGLNVYGGKINNPFFTPGATELIWDGDLTPEGIGVVYSRPLSEKDTLNLAGGGFWVQESSAGADTSLWGIQSYWKHAMDKDYILAGAGYFDYANIQGLADRYGILAGNTPTPGGGAWGSDFNLFEMFAEYGTHIGGLPVSFYGDWVNNLSAVTDKDTGWLIGTSINKCKDPGSWAARYNYRELQADAVVGAFTDSDFIGGGTDGKGHEFGFDYQLHKNVQLGLTYFYNQLDRGAGSNGLDYRRLQADIVVKFK